MWSPKYSFMSCCLLLSLAAFFFSWKKFTASAQWRSASRDKYRNPPAPPGYVSEVKPALKLKDDLIEIDGVICQFIKPMIEVGLFEHTWEEFQKFIPNSDSEDEVVEVPVDPKIPPVIDLEVDEDDDELSEAVQEEQNPLPSEQIQVVDKTHELPNAGKEKKSTTKSDASAIENIAKKRQSDELSTRISPARNANQVTEQRSKSPPVYKKASPKKVSKPEASPKKKSGKEKHDSHSSDGSSAQSPYSKSSRKSVEYITERKRSTSRGRSPKRASKHEGSPKRREGRKDKHDGYYSDGSAHSDYSRKKSPKEYKRHSRSRSASVEDKKVDIKFDPDEPNLFGRYHCKHCNATMNSIATYETHLSGKRHLKNLKLKNVVETVQKTIQQPIHVESKYPPPPSGMHRMRVKTRAKIQAIVENSIKTPCPGLDNLIEIRGATETTYYCELCSAPCSTATIISHLTGYRHLLRCLKHFDPDRYEIVRDRKKYEVERSLEKWLKDIERKVGRGRIAVEEEIPIEQVPHGILNMKLERKKREDMPGPSHRDPEDSFPENYASTTIPDTSKSDYYCKICDSHMNNISMWEMHIRGKRHLTNVKKAPGQQPSKSKTVLLPNARAKIMNEIDLVPDPIVGLGNMREVQNPDAPGELYNCFLCGACLTSRDVVDHVLSLKHRKKYLEEIDHPEMATLKNMNMLDLHLESVIEEICYKVESQSGRGIMEVHMVKNNLAAGRTW